MAYTIMIVDDSETIRAILERTLAMTKLPIDGVIQAKHGKEALEKLGNNWVDIVFTDINMPEMDGMQLVAEMANRSDLKDIPVVVISTEGSATRIKDLESKGIKGYLRKPFTPENIRDIILKTLGEWEK